MPILLTTTNHSKWNGSHKEQLLQSSKAKTYSNYLCFQKRDSVSKVDGFRMTPTATQFPKDVIIGQNRFFLKNIFYLNAHVIFGKQKPQLHLVFGYKRANCLISNSLPLNTIQSDATENGDRLRHNHWARKTQWAQFISILIWYVGGVNFRYKCGGKGVRAVSRFGLAVRR